MILVNSEWGKHLAEHVLSHLRTQQNGKVKMSTVPHPIRAWAWRNTCGPARAAPLCGHGEPAPDHRDVARREPAYPKNDTALYATMRDFDTMYGIYNDFPAQHGTLLVFALAAAGKHRASRSSCATRESGETGQHPLVLKCRHCRNCPPIPVCNWLSARLICSI